MSSAYKKKTGGRDFTKIVIAVEGHKREKQYFDWFNDQKSRVTIAVLYPKNERDDNGNRIDNEGRVKPAEILGRLETYVQKNDIKDVDKLWIVMDADKFKGEHEILDFAKEISQAPLNADPANRHLSLSLPCFELWLLLHITDVAKGQSWGNCGELKQFLPTILPSGFDSSRHISLKNVAEAIERSKRLNTSTTIIPSNPGTVVHDLAEVLLSVIR